MRVRVTFRKKVEIEVEFFLHILCNFVYCCLSQILERSNFDLLLSKRFFSNVPEKFVVIKIFLYWQEEDFGAKHPVMFLI